jgi:hypothetical protein
MTQLCEPTIVKEALSSSDSHHWQDAMNKEYAFLIQNGTWQLVDLPPNCYLISTKWLFYQKYNFDGPWLDIKQGLSPKDLYKKKGLTILKISP